MKEDLSPVNEGEIKAMLEARRGDWQTIAELAHVSHSWISKFVNGRISKQGPGTNTLRQVRSAIAANDEHKARA